MEAEGVAHLHHKLFCLPSGFLALMEVHLEPQALHH